MFKKNPNSEAKKNNNKFKTLLIDSKKKQFKIRARIKQKNIRNYFVTKKQQTKQFINFKNSNIIFAITII